MTLRQLTIKASKRIGQIGVDRKDGGGPIQVVPHHLEITDRSERGAEPQQLIAQAMCLWTYEQRCESRQAAAQSPRRHSHPVDGVRAVDASSRLIGPQLPCLGAQVGRHQPTGAALVGRRRLTHLLNLRRANTSSALTEWTREQRPLAL